MKRTSSIPRATREQILSITNSSAPEIRALVKNYYDAQEMRKRSDLQLRHQGVKDNPQGLLYYADTHAALEKDVEKMLTAVAEGNPVGRWILSHHGIGPVIAAGLLAHIDIEEAPTAGHIWSFAGLNPDQKWEKGEKRPYNAELKQICWHTGNCIMRTHKAEESFYGKLYKQQKELVIERNERGQYAERAKIFYTNSITVKNILKQGKLPPFNLDAQARRFAVKIFLSHLQAVMWWDKYGVPPVGIFAKVILGHAHEIKIPNLNMFPGLEEAYYDPAWNYFMQKRQGQRMMDMVDEPLEPVALYNEYSSMRKTNKKAAKKSTKKSTKKRSVGEAAE